MKDQTFQEKKTVYMREWYKLHPEKYYLYQIRYWQKKLDQLKSQAVINKTETPSGSSPAQGSF